MAGQGACLKCGATGPGVELSFCAACHCAQFCSRACQEAAWPEHKVLCKESRSPFRKQLFRGVVRGRQLQLSLERDDTEGFAHYLRDKMPTARELHASGLDAVLRSVLAESESCHDATCTLCPAVAATLRETLDFAATRRPSRAMRKLQGAAASTAGSTLFYPGAELDMTQPLALLAGPGVHVSRMVCVSSFEVDSIQSRTSSGAAVTPPTTARFIELLELELRGSPMVRDLRVIADSRVATAAPEPSSEPSSAPAVLQQQPPRGAAAPEPAARPLRFEYEVTLVACPASEPVAVGARVPSSGGGEAGKRVSIVYYVNEDFESFWPPELQQEHEDDKVAIVYAAKVPLPLWRASWTATLQSVASDTALFMSDTTTLLEPPLPMLLLGAAEAGMQASRLQSVIQDRLFLPLLTELPLLHPQEDLIVHSVKNSQPFTFRVLSAWVLGEVLQRVQGVVDAALEMAGEAADRVLEGAERGSREFRAAEFADVVRADGFSPASVSASMRQLLRGFLSLDPPKARQRVLSGWSRAEQRSLRTAVGMEDAG